MIDYKTVTTRIVDSGGDGKVVEHSRCEKRLCAGDLVLTPACQKVIRDAIGIAKALNHQWLGNEHILLAMSAPLATGAVAEMKINPRKVCEAFTLDIKEVAAAVEKS